MILINNKMNDFILKMVNSYKRLRTSTSMQAQFFSLSSNPALNNELFDVIYN